MTDKQENKRSMYLAVQNVCNANNDIWNTMPAFVQAFTDFEALLGHIDTQRQIQEGKTTGITQNKQQEEDEMTQAAIEMAAAVYAYASRTGDNALRARVDYSPSSLRRSRDTALRDICQNIHDAASAIIADLADYGKTPADLDQLQQEINDYAAILANPREAIGTRATATARLVTLFREADDLLKNQLDKLMLTYQNTQATFHNKYKNARIIVDLGKSGGNTENETPPSE